MRASLFVERREWSATNAIVFLAFTWYDVLTCSGGVGAGAGLGSAQQPPAALISVSLREYIKITRDLLKEGRGPPPF